MNILIIFIIVCTNLIINCFLATGVSTIKIGDQLNLTSQLLSPISRFTLGFFTINATNHTYLGIWYTNDLDFTKVWVANPSTPIRSSFGVLMIHPDTRRLIISTGGTTLLNISDSQYTSSPNLTATLEETGNFQLKNQETDDQTLWQSFDYPTNVLLPGMKLGVDLRTERSWNLTSWMSDEIPDSGAFTLSWEPTGKTSQRFMIRRRGQPYWTSGNLNNQIFPYMFQLNIPYSRTIYNLSFVYSHEERYFSFHDISGYLPMWVLNPGGQVHDNDNIGVWTPEFCYGYDSDGCVADSNMLQYRSENDKFSSIKGDFARDMTRVSYDDNSSLSISDCMVRCWNDCSCLGFITSTNGTTCNTWYGTKSINNFSIDPERNAAPKYVLVSSNLGKENAKKWIWAPVVASIILLLFCLALLWYLKKSKLGREEENRKKRDDEYFLEPMASDNFKDATNLESNGRKGTDLVVFSFAAIATATNEFASENKLGEGGFGPVYKGKLSDEQEIAIKRLSITSGQGLVEFKNELVLIAKLQHRNLVRVLGCCISGEEKMLIYEYMPNKSLGFFIFDETRKTLLDWPKRWNIIEGISQGLLYLHKYSRTRVIHRDMKASNDCWNIAWELWLKGDALVLEDQTLTNTHVIHQLLRTIHVALLCIQENALDRPEMSDVISMLNNDTMSLPVPKQPTFFIGRSVLKSTSVERKLEDYSVNNMTITVMEAQ
ncbi:unnamed protein product [Lactuca virosa]|uniref:Receptor-like serine/threonine-protein kinase n=1 Tax=Lactuca virosa TaxID=75947 RepID=A0AAU9MRK7_9ASTR|nr:unnamed protein product [Lactuca virosa]